jgi:hypothetical protein
VPLKTAWVVKTNVTASGSTPCACEYDCRPFDTVCNLCSCTYLLVDHLNDADLLASGLDWAMPLQVQGCCIAARCRCSERRAIGA